MLGADLVRVASTGLIAVLLLSGDAELWHLVVLYAVDGAATAFFNPASDALMPQLILLLAPPGPTALIALAALLAGTAGTYATVLWESTWVQFVPAAAGSRVSAYDWFGSLALEPLGLALRHEPPSHSDAGSQ